MSESQLLFAANVKYFERKQFFKDTSISEVERVEEEDDEKSSNENISWGDVYGATIITE